MSKELHIVTHDIPWPANYGGVVDLFYKIKCLHEEGILIHLHCYYKEGERHPSPILESYCHEVHYYKRSSYQPWAFSIPYIVQSRNSRKLLHNLKRDNHPIFFEGIHTTYWLLKKEFANRQVFVRLHNEEALYYHRLFRQERHLFKKIYYKIESKLLHWYQKRLKGKAGFITVSKEDMDIFVSKYGYSNIQYLPVFLPWQQVTANTGIGNYCLYHGNLAVNENSQAALWLLKNVFNELTIPFVIAGHNPPKWLIEAAHEKSHTCMVENPSEFEMEDLIRKAQINILPSLNATGIKLKLLHALFTGRHCIVNKNGWKGLPENDGVVFAETAMDFKKQVRQLYQLSFNEESRTERTKLLKEYDNKKNASLLINWLYSHYQ